MSGEPELAERLEIVRRAHALPGLAAAVVRGGSVRTGAAGRARLDASAPATPDTLFEIASLTKPFTAELVLTLVADGTLELGADLTATLGAASGGRYALPDAWRGVAVRHALAHQSGLPG